MDEKPPPYNPASPPPAGPPPPYQPMPPPYQPAMPPYQPAVPQSAQIGFVMPGSSTTIVTSQHPSYGTIPTVVQPVAGADVIVIGGCPACKVGFLNEEFTLPGLCCAFWFFPLGILCCLAMRERRCSNCGACFS